MVEGQFLVVGLVGCGDGDIVDVVSWDGGVVFYQVDGCFYGEVICVGVLVYVFFVGVFEGGVYFIDEEDV